MNRNSSQSCGNNDASGKHTPRHFESTLLAASPPMSEGERGRTPLGSSWSMVSTPRNEYQSREPTFTNRLVSSGGWVGGGGGSISAAAQVSDSSNVTLPSVTSTIAPAPATPYVSQHRASQGDPLRPDTLPRVQGAGHWDHNPAAAPLYENVDPPPAPEAPTRTPAAAVVQPFATTTRSGPSPDRPSRQGSYSSFDIVSPFTSIRRVGSGASIAGEENVVVFDVDADFAESIPSKHFGNWLRDDCAAAMAGDPRSPGAESAGTLCITPLSVDEVAGVFKLDLSSLPSTPAVGVTPRDEQLEGSGFPDDGSRPAAIPAATSAESQRQYVLVRQRQGGHARSILLRTTLPSSVMGASYRTSPGAAAALVAMKKLQHYFTNVPSSGADVGSPAQASTTRIVQALSESKRRRAHPHRVPCGEAAVADPLAPSTHRSSTTTSVSSYSPPDFMSASGYCATPPRPRTPNNSPLLEEVERVVRTPCSVESGMTTPVAGRPCERPPGIFIGAPPIF